ncbi:hypothetical protein OP862_15835 [Yersinia massiliensis]|uniref:hypothetical protein n=1 Tax=Yersinia TaxID=629 RepID=UPI0005DC6D2D|nr:MULTISPECIES: hypothetical protein [Yersinia]MDA5547598.1 hypothetical protein [Yersinia massiliensis]UZM78004.1 hypothetical protein OP862_15835 [Yersinia massiliensis]CFR14624.1 Uncharacterised protein [Yersinia frederiksenii]
MMHWTILSGSVSDFIGAPHWAKRLCVQRGTGQKLWWDGMQKYQDKEQLLDAYTSDFDECVDILAERRLVPIGVEN